MKIILDWFLKQNIWIKILIIAVITYPIYFLFNKKEINKMEAKREKERVFEDSISKLTYFQRNDSLKVVFIKSKFDGMPPQWREIKETFISKFNYPLETEVELPENYFYPEFKDGKVVVKTNIKSKNGFGIKTQNTGIIYYKIDSLGLNFEVYDLKIDGIE